eukprot:358340-Chlamydomonas_euryale.AAC.4
MPWLPGQRTPATVTVGSSGFQPRLLDGGGCSWPVDCRPATSRQSAVRPAAVARTMHKSCTCTCCIMRAYPMTRIACPVHDINVPPRGFTSAPLVAVVCKRADSMVWKLCPYVFREILRGGEHNDGACCKQDRIRYGEFM